MAVIDSFCAKDTYELGEKIGQMAKPGMVIFTNQQTAYVNPSAELEQKLKQ